MNAPVAPQAQHGRVTPSQVSSARARAVLVLLLGLAPGTLGCKRSDQQPGAPSAAPSPAKTAEPSEGAPYEGAGEPDSYALVIASGKNLEELEQAVKAFPKPEALRLRDGFPRVLATNEAGGLPAGERVAVLGVCAVKDEAEAAREVAVVFSSDAVTLKTIKAPALTPTCPQLKLATGDEFGKVKARAPVRKDVPSIEWVVRSGRAPWKCLKHTVSIERAKFPLWVRVFEDNCNGGDSRHARESRERWTIDPYGRWNHSNGEQEVLTKDPEREKNPVTAMNEDITFSREFAFALPQVGARRLLAVDTFVDNTYEGNFAKTSIVKRVSEVLEHLDWTIGIYASSLLFDVYEGKVRVVLNEPRWWGSGSLRISTSEDKWPAERLTFKYFLYDYAPHAPGTPTSAMSLPQTAQYRWSSEKATYEFESVSASDAAQP